MLPRALSHDSAGPPSSRNVAASAARNSFDRALNGQLIGSLIAGLWFWWNGFFSLERKEFSEI